MTLDPKTVVQGVLQKLRLLNADGTMKAIDSLQVLDIADELESTLEISIPSSWLELRRFQSADTLMELVRELTEKDA